MQRITVFRNFLQGLMIFAFLFHASSASASLGARPAYLFVNLEKRNPSGTFTVTNMGDKPQTYRANAVHFAITEKGSVETVKPDDYSLAKWIKFNPKEFTLAPKTSREIRFSIIRRKHLQHREYWGAIEFMPLKGFKYHGKPDAAGRQMNFEVLTSLLIPIFGSTEGIKYKGKVGDITAQRLKDKMGFTALVENTGSGVLRLDGELEIFDAASAKSMMKSSVSIFNVLPEQKRRIRILGSESLPAGHYNALLHLHQQNPDEVILSYQQEFDLP